MGPQIVIHRQTQESEDGQGEAAREMDIAASLLLGEEALFAEFSGDIFGTTTEVEKASNDSAEAADEVMYEISQQEDQSVMGRDGQTRQVQFNKLFNKIRLPSKAKSTYGKWTRKPLSYRESSHFSSPCNPPF